MAASDDRGEIIYDIGEDGVLRGRWTMLSVIDPPLTEGPEKTVPRRITVGTEKAVPRRITGNFGGEYHVEIYDDKGHTGFDGTLTITPEGGVFRISWTPSKTSRVQVAFDGVGHREGDRQAVAAFWTAVRKA